MERTDIFRDIAERTGGICISALLGAFAPANPHLFGGSWS